VTDRAVRAAGGLIVAVVLAACAGGPVRSSVTPAVSASTSPTPSSPVPSRVEAGVVAVDDGLLGHLPAEVGGIRLTSDPATAGNIASDPDLAANASAIAMAYAIAPGASAGDDVVVVSVVQLRPDVFSPEYFRSWRDSYDKAACDVAGGVAGNAEAQVGGRQTYIGNCVGGPRTYHVYLEASNVIVSVTSVGERRLGEQVVAGLRE
jgi:hypothetical protein